MEKLSTLSEEVIEDLTKNGSDLSQPHDFDFFLYFETREIAEQVKEELNRANYVSEVKLSGDGNGWLCLAKRSFIPTTEDLNITGNLLVTIAEDFNGEFDGWEVNIV